MNAIRLTTPAALIAAVPMILGFVPERSIIVVALRGGTVLFAARLDVAGARALAPQLVDAATQQGAESVVIVTVVDADANTVSAAIDEAHEVREAAAHVGIETEGSYYAPVIGAGHIWHDLDTAATGIIGATDAADLYAATGANVLPDRRSREIPFRMLASAVDVDAAASTLWGLDAVPALVRRTLPELIEVIAEDRTASNDLAARVGVLAQGGGNPRDSLLSVGDADGNPVPILAHIAARLRGAARVHVLTVTAVCAHFQGDGAAANMAADAARASVEPDADNPGQFRLLEMFETVLQNAMKPEVSGELIATGHTVVTTVFGSD